MSRSKPGSEEGLNSVRRRAIVPLLLGFALWLLPVPRGLTANAWSYFALCVAVIAALITEPVPGPVAGLLGITAAAALLLVAPDPNESIRWALSGFSNGTVWLIFVAFMFGLGYEKTGLGRRIALSLVRLLGRRTLGLGYAVALSDLVLAPLMPSNTARSGGTVFPIIRSIPAVYHSFPARSPRRIGAYLMWTAFAAQSITSSMFLTANAANLFAVSFMKETAKISIGWADWAVGFLPVGLLLFVSLPALVYVIYPPRVKASRNVPRWAARELVRMGPISGRELLMAAVALLALMLWVFGGERLNAPMVALIALCLMILTRVVEWSDVLAHKDAWRVLLWFGTLLTLADGLSRVGFLRWFARGAATVLTGVPVVVMMLLFIAAFFIAHYMFGESHRPRHGALPRLPRDRDGGPGYARPAAGARALLHARPHGRVDPVRDGAGADLLRERVHHPEGVLDSRLDLRHDLRSGPPGRRPALPPRREPVSRTSTSASL